MKIAAQLKLKESIQGPDPWDESWGISLPLDHVICRDVDGTPHTVAEFVWPWAAYTPHKSKLFLHFYYWKKKKNEKISEADITPDREVRMRELQFLMTRQLYFGDENAPITLYRKLIGLHHIARFAEERSRTVRDVLTQKSLLDACVEELPDHKLNNWMNWFNFLRELDPDTQLGFTLATPREWKDVQRRSKEHLDKSRQYAPLPTSIYAALINNLSAELDDIEVHLPQLLAALMEGISAHAEARANRVSRVSLGPDLIDKHDLADFFERRGKAKILHSLTSVIFEIFTVCKLQIHVFSGMRDVEANRLPYHCMNTQNGFHGRRHCLIAGVTTKFNKGRRLRTKWVTTEREGFRAIRLAQKFAAVIYDAIDKQPSKADDLKDDFPLFPSTEYLPWMSRKGAQDGSIAAMLIGSRRIDDSLLSRLCPLITEEDIAELEEIDPFRVWHEEPEFAVGQRWPLTTHQLRRSLALYANASGLVRLSSLRRQLQHMTREMSLYYGRGSTFCKDFLAADPGEYKKHVAVDWQDGEEEAESVAFVREVLNSNERLFGGSGNFYERQRERGEVMSREDVSKQIKAGKLAYRDGPLGGCTRSGVCESRKGLNLIDTVCATNGCKHLIGKHSKIVQTIRLKRAAMAHITPGSITEVMEREELEALEFVEREWRPQPPVIHSTGGVDG